MRSYLMILPIALLVTYSQLMVKWRSGLGEHVPDMTIWQQLVKFPV